MTPAKLFASLCKQYTFWILSTVALSLLEAFFNSVGTALIVPSVLGYMGLVNPAHIFSGNTSIWLASFGIVSAQFLPLFVLGIFFLKNIISPCLVAVRAELIQRMELGLRVSMLNHLLGADLSLLRTIPSGDVLHRMMYGLSHCVAAFGLLLDGIRMTLSVLALAAILIYLSWQLTLLVGALSLMFALFLHLTTKMSHRLGQQKTRVNKVVGIRLKELVDGIRTIKERSCEDLEQRRFLRFLRLQEKVYSVLRLHNALSQSFYEVVALSVLFGVLFVLRWKVLAIDESVLLIYLPVLFRLLPNLKQLSLLCVTVPHSYAEFALVCDFFNQSSQKALTSGSVPFERVSTQIQLENVRFSHPAMKEPLFDGLSLQIERGTTIAVVGISGAGKTTLCDLLLRFYDPDGGRILFDNTDLRDFEVDSLRRRIAIVSQDNYLFSRSIKANITLGDFGLAKEQLDESILAAGLEEVVKGLPHGVNTVMGERGSSLSLGQRQRVAIARAIITQPEILILDEATGAVDPEMDRQIHVALRQMGPQCTRIIISHRPSTIRQAQVIALLSRGKIAELGSHEELMQLQGEYARLYGDN